MDGGPGHLLPVKRKLYFSFELWLTFKVARLGSCMYCWGRKRRRKKSWIEPGMIYNDVSWIGPVLFSTKKVVQFCVCTYITYTSLSLYIQKIKCQRTSSVYKEIEILMFWKYVTSCTFQWQLDVYLEITYTYTMHKPFWHRLYTYEGLESRMTSTPRGNA